MSVLINLAGLGLVDISKLATDAQAAAFEAQYNAGNAGGNGYSAIVTRVTVGRLMSNGDLEVMVQSPGSSGLAYEDAGVIPASVLGQAGVSMPTGSSQGYLTNAQTAAILNALNSQDNVPAQPSACFNPLSKFVPDTCVSTKIPVGVVEMAVVAGVVLLLLVGGKK